MLRVAAFFFAGLIAGAAGVLYVWFNGRISPGTVSVSEVVSVLVIAVIVILLRVIRGRRVL